VKLRLGLTLILFVSSAAAFAWVAFKDKAPSGGQPEATSEFERVAARMMAREAIAWEVLEGRLSLQEGAAVFDWLNHQPPVLNSEAPHRCTFGIPDAIDDRGLSGESYLCHSVLTYVCSFENATPARISEMKSAFRRTCETPCRFSLPNVVESDCVELLERSREAWLVCRYAGNPRRPTVSAHDLRFVVRAKGM